MQKRGNAVILEYVNYRPTDFPGGALFWKEKYEKSVKEYEKTEEELEKTRKQATQNDSTSMEKEKQIKENNIILGLTEVQGDGIIITLQDNTYKNNLHNYSLCGFFM